MKIQTISHMGMTLDRWIYESCTADFGVADTFATLYLIESLDKGKGHATALLTEAKKHYESKGLEFAGSIALNENMRKLYKKLNIVEHQ